MTHPSNELEHQIEKAFDYRGNVTLTMKNGTSIECFLFNREFADSRAPQKNFVEVFLVGSGEKQKFSIADIASVQLTGEDHAAGKSYEEWLTKQKKG